MSTPIFNEVTRDTGIDFDAIASRPRWDFKEADARIRQGILNKVTPAKQAEAKPKAPAAKKAPSKGAKR